MKSIYLIVIKRIQIIPYWMSCGTLCFPRSWSISLKCVELFVACSDSPCFIPVIGNLCLFPFFFVTRAGLPNQWQTSLFSCFLLFLFRFSVFDFVDFCSLGFVFFPGSWRRSIGDWFETFLQYKNLCIHFPLSTVSAMFLFFFFSSIYNILLNLCSNFGSRQRFSASLYKGGNELREIM